MWTSQWRVKQNVLHNMFETGERMDINLLRTFLAVANFEGLRKASEYLHLTPSAVSSRIRQLEGEIGAQLFDRGRNGVVLSHAGERLKPRAEAMVEQWNKLKQEVLQVEQNLLSIRLGGTDIIWRAWLLPKLQSMADFSDISFTLRTGSRLELTRKLIDGSLDCAVLPAEIKYPGIYSVQVASLELVLVRSAGTSSGEQTDWFVDVDWGDAHRAGMAEFRQTKHTLLADTNVAWLGLEWLLQVGGTAWLPRTLAEPYLNDARLLAVPDVNSLESPIFVNMSRDHSLVYERLRRMLSV
ncbi:MAG: hypothetical protein AUJ56_01970 [Zetaproteobacteria bacterium CG1_02_49_23]|nr:MAG: hypothetical protein AUJ56_01970 [Zetaproteobacteria bacterium CG1_02_49_23]